MATTLKGTDRGAKRNFLSKSGLRYAGLISAFIGITILLIGRKVTSTVLQVSAVILLLVGALLISGNTKKLFKKSKDKDIVLYLLIGVLLLVCGILLCIYYGQISNWIDIVIGVLIAFYGLIALINFCVHKKGKYFIIDVIISCLFIATGVMIALMYEFSSSTYTTIVGIFATITGASSILLY